MKKINKLTETHVKAFLNEYTDHDFSGAKVIADAKSKKPDSEDMEFITKYFPNAVKSMSKAEANLKASDASPIKARMGRYAPMFVHVQYHTFTETSGQTFSVHQTQYYNSNFKDKPGGEKFNPRVTELYFMKKDEMSKIGGLDEKMGVILALTDEYIKDLRDLDRLGMLGKRVSESLNEEDKFYDADKEQEHDEEDMPGGYDDEGRPLDKGGEEKLSVGSMKKLKGWDLNEGKGLDAATKLIKQLREKLYRTLNDQELEEFTKEMVDHLGGTINENKMNTKTESIVKRLKEDTEYQKFFKSAMDKFGIKSPKDLSDKKKKEFFNYVDKNYKAKNEEVSESYESMKKAGESDLLLMRAYIEEKYSRDEELKDLFNDVLNTVQINSQVQSWKAIKPLYVG